MNLVSKSKTLVMFCLQDVRINLENNISNYHGNKEVQRNIIENNLSNIIKALSLLEVKFNETVGDLPKTIENYTKLKMSTLETSISQKLHEAVSRLE